MSRSVQREIEAEARKLFPDAVRRVEWLRYGDTPIIEPDELPGPQAVPPRTRERWPEIRHVGVMFEDDRGHHRGSMIQALDDEHGPDYRGVPVTVRLEPAELETADRLITAGIAASRAEALRWALGRIPEDGA
jgi:hypothetical protein